jgi:hypothetical protein
VQVANMGRVFNEADRVIAWLGPEENNSDLAMTWFQTIGRKLDVDWKTQTMRPRQREGTEKSTAQEEQGTSALVNSVDERGSLPWTIEEARAIYFVLIRPYFERAWVVQEIRLARHVYFQCGEDTISENSLWVVMMGLNRKCKMSVGFISSEAWFKARQRIWYLALSRMQRTNETILTLRQNLGHFLCNDARDKIYSALSLMDQSTKNLTIVPTYSQATSQIYVDIARRVITRWLNLDILNDCELSSRVLDIPSWVPDWSTPLKSEHLRRTWSACAYVACRPSFDASGRQCTVSGIRVGRIVEVREQPYTQNAADIQERLELIRSLRPPEDDLNSLYMTGERLMEVYCRVLVGNQFLPTHGEGPNYAASLEVLEAVWSGNRSESVSKFKEELRSPNSYFRRMSVITRNRMLFKTSSGHLGLAPLGSQPGDLLCILLGCRNPVILRPAAHSTYQVVGTCYAHGLMNGEAIYRNTHVEDQCRASRQDAYDVSSGSETGKRATSHPATMLEEAGIKTEGKTEKDISFGIFVGKETLEDAGIPVQDLVLV